MVGEVDTEAEVEEAEDGLEAAVEVVDIEAETDVTTPSVRCSRTTGAEAVLDKTRRIMVAAILMGIRAITVMNTMHLAVRLSKSSGRVTAPVVLLKEEEEEAAGISMPTTEASLTVDSGRIIMAVVSSRTTTMGLRSNRISTVRLRSPISKTTEAMVALRPAVHRRATVIMKAPVAVVGETTGNITNSLVAVEATAMRTTAIRLFLSSQ